jgi:hypothetical protein
MPACPVRPAGVSARILHGLGPAIPLGGSSSVEDVAIVAQALVRWNPGNPVRSRCPDVAAPPCAP